MKTRSKIGGRKGSPAYRTPSSFRFRKNVNIINKKAQSGKKPTV